LVTLESAQGAGKSHTINWLVIKGLFPLLAFVSVDPDEIRRRLPEFSLYLQVCPDKAGELTRKEAGYIAEILTLAALQAGKNVLVDGSLRDSGWYTLYFARLRREYPNNKIAILHVVAPRDAVFQRAADRARKTGRIVPRETLELALDQVPRSVHVLAPLADYFCELNNAPGLDIEILTEGQDWDDFQVQWLQMCAWVPKKKRTRKNVFGTRRQRFTEDSVGNEGKGEGTKQKQHDNPEERRRASVHAMKAAPLRSHVDRKIVLTSSTEENYQSASMEFYGPFSHIRETLDYSYHKNYRKERQWLQDMIVKDVIADSNCEKSLTPDPWLIYVTGVTGAGKIHTVRQLMKNEYLPLCGLVLVDREKVRSYLPEFSLYAEQHPTTADSLTRKEVEYVSEIVTLAALQAGGNVVVAEAMEDVNRYREKVFPRIKRDFPTLRIAILHVVAPMRDVLSRVEKLAMDTCHEVPQEVLKSQLEQVETSVQSLMSVVDYSCKIHNPQREGLTIISDDESWDTFQLKWGQSYIRIPR